MKTYIHLSNSRESQKRIFRSTGCLGIVILMVTLAINVHSQDLAANFKFDCRSSAKVSTFNEFLKKDNTTCDSSLERVPVDTAVLKLKKKMFIFHEYEDGAIIDRIDLETGERKRILDVDENCESRKDTNKFRGHWSGIEYGLNNLMTSTNSFARPDGYGYMRLNTFGSWNLNLNFAQSSTAIIGEKFGIVGGLGLEMNFYSFRGDNNIQVSEESGEIEERILADDYNVRKSKFRTMYLTSPLLLEAQFGKNKSKDRFYISGGVLGGLRIGSTTKIVHGVDGKRQKLVERGKDLNINRWRWGLTARMGYKEAFNFYATYYMTPLFEKNKGTELYPLAVGFRMNF